MPEHNTMEPLYVKRWRTVIMVPAAIKAEICAALWRNQGGEALERVKNAIDFQLNEELCKMQVGYDDSVVGFNEAWDIVRKVFAEPLAASTPTPEIGEVVAWAYELATVIDVSDHKYTKWERRLSWEKPNVPEGSIRNLHSLIVTQRE